MSDQEWRVLDGEGNEQGPYSFQDLQSYYTSGNITHETMIWTEGLEEWVPAGQVEGLLPNIPQVIPLAPAPTVEVAAPVAQPIDAGGINLSPQIPGIAPAAAPGEPMTEAPAKAGVPTWLGMVTLVIGIAALILFFFPWVSVSQDVSETRDIKMAKMMTQSGIQSINRDASWADEFLSLAAKEDKMSEEEVEKQLKEVFGDLSDGDYDKSTLVLIAMILVGVGLLLALIGLVNQTKTLVVISQASFVAAAILIGIQMAQQFPMIKLGIERHKEVTESRQKLIDAQKELVEATTSMAESLSEKVDEETKAKMDADTTDAKNQMAESIHLAEIKNKNSLATGFEASCFATVGILSISILLVVVTMSVGNGSTLIVANPSLQPQLQPGQPQQPAQPQQPGSGLKFH